MKQQKPTKQLGKKLSYADMKKIKGGTSLTCTIEEQEECTIDCSFFCAPESFCNSRCICKCL